MSDPRLQSGTGKQQQKLTTSHSVPVLELIRLGTGSNAAAIILCIILIVNNATSALGSAVAMSRQGYAFARDGGLFWNSKCVGWRSHSMFLTFFYSRETKVVPRLTEMSSGTHLPFWSINVPSAMVALVGLM